MTVFGMDRLGQEHIPADNTQIDSFGTTFSAVPLYLPTTSKVLLVPDNQYTILFDVYNICTFLKNVQGHLLEHVSHSLLSVLVVNDRVSGASRRNDDRCSERHLLLGD
jgi:hypothetical protein